MTCLRVHHQLDYNTFYYLLKSKNFLWIFSHMLRNKNRLMYFSIIELNFILELPPSHPAKWRHRSALLGDSTTAGLNPWEVRYVILSQKSSGVQTLVRSLPVFLSPEAETRRLLSWKSHPCSITHCSASQFVGWTLCSRFLAFPDSEILFCFQNPGLPLESFALQDCFLHHDLKIYI